MFKDGAIPNVPPREHIRPTDMAPIVRPLDPADPCAGAELVDARWWLKPRRGRRMRGLPLQKDAAKTEPTRTGKKGKEAGGKRPRPASEDAAPAN